MKTGAAATLLITRLPLVPPPTVVVFVTRRGKPPTVNVELFPMERLLPIVKPAAVAVALAPRLTVKLPVTEVVPANKVFNPAPDKVRLL